MDAWRERTRQFLGFPMRRGPGTEAHPNPLREILRSSLISACALRFVVLVEAPTCALSSSDHMTARPLRHVTYNNSGPVRW